MVPPLSRLKKLAGIGVGSRARVGSGVGGDSDKVGKVLSVDGGWVQLLTLDGEFVWLPRKLVNLAEGRTAPFPAFDVMMQARQNTQFRNVIYTGRKIQIALMSLLPGEDIGEEIHDAVEQVFTCVLGKGLVTSRNSGQFWMREGDMVIVPKGRPHNIANVGSVPLKLITSYSPPNHIPGVIHRTKADAEADKDDKDVGHSKRSD